MTWPNEIVDAVIPLLRSKLAWILAVALALGWAIVFDRWVRTKWIGLQRPVLVLALLGGASGGLWLAWQRKWLCDDAFITFAYSQNFARGHGLVFNPGEWVEGFTNLLWAVLLGVLGKLGLDIPLTAFFLNLASFVAALALAALIPHKALGEQTRSTLPFAALALAASTPFTTWATSGLETMPCTALVLAAVWRAIAGGRVSAGLLLAAAALARPDHALFGPAMVLALAMSDRVGRVPWRKSLEGILRFGVPFAAVFTVVWLWRWKAYGEFFPNTYYAKSGGQTYTEQGLVYVVHYLATTGAWLLVPLFLLVGLKRSRNPADTLVRTFTLVGTVLLGTYVYRVGGDFMEHRFLLVLLPLLAVSLELTLRAREHKLLIPVACLAFGVAVQEIKPIGPWEKKWHLAAEETFYALTQLEPLKIQSRNFDYAQVLRKTFAGVEVKPKFATGCVGFVGYYSGLPVTDTYGLTLPSVAHKPISVRGRPGHEKRADLKEALADGAVFTDEHLQGEWLPETRLDLPEGFPGYLLRYDAKLVDIVRKAGGFAADVDAEIARHARAWSKDELTRARSFFASYLEKDPERERRLAPLDAQLASVSLDVESARRLPWNVVPEALRGLETRLPSDAPVLAALKERVAARWTFDEPELGADVVRHGKAFPAAVTGSIGGQTALRGQQGRKLLNSYLGGHDGETGRVELSLIGQSQLLVGLLVGGGSDCNKTYVGLEVGGAVVQRVCGQNDEVLRPATMAARLSPGQSAKLVIVDDSSGAWGHVLADDVVVVASPPGPAAP